MSEQPAAPHEPGIAIIGMTGRFPGASSVEQFWENLIDGVDSVSRFRREELEDTPERREQPGYIAARSVLKDVGDFDAAFFGIYPREAEQMDPQHRIFLECCWEAFERAGYDPLRYPGAVSVFAGCSMNTYFMRSIARDRAFLERFTEDYQAGSYTAMLGNDKDFLPTRVSYKLNLRGPSISIQTACSTSLVAVCQACQSLLTYGCDMALAGGVSITFPQHRGYVPEEGGIMSTDGAIRPFDHRAQGTVFGSGAGVVLLKRLEDALADGDSVLAVIRGFGLNNDGSLKAGYTAPSVQGQAEVITAAQAMADIPASSISYVETHGTGTPLGDPIEIAGLSQAFAEAASRPETCYLGTAKAHVGHLDIAAGVTGLIKTVLQMEHRTIPGLLHFERLNPKINLAKTPFALSAQTLPWDSNGGPLRAGVSAFGVGGTNAHVVVEQPPVPAPGKNSGDRQLLVLSAKTTTALDRMRQDLAAYLESHPEIPLADVAHTLAAGRARHAFRFAGDASTANEAATRLLPTNGPKAATALANAQIVFVFPGQGSQHLNMGRTLYDAHPVFRDALTQCDELLRPLLGESLLDAMYPETETPEAVGRLNQTRLAQPAIFAIEYALFRLWESFGITPSLLIGHSIGEYAAACAAGSLSLEDALHLVAARGSLMQALPPGSMLAVRATEERVRPLLDEGLSLAAINAPTAVVVAGPGAAVDAFAARLEGLGIASRKLATSHAFHSSMVEPALEPFREHLERVQFHAPRIPWISTLSGDELTAADVADPAYWLRQIREPVAFRHALEAAARQLPQQAVFLEAGPGATVLGAMRQTLVPGIEAARLLTSLALPAESRPEANAESNNAPLVNGTGGILPALGKLWMLGVEPDWKRVQQNSIGRRPRRVLLPTYPFERKRYWVDPPAAATAASLPQNAVASTGTLFKNSCGVTVPLMASPVCAAPDTLDLLVSELKAVVTELSDLDLKQTPPETSLVELGLDSLFLTQLTQSIRSRYGVKLTFRQIMGEHGSFQALASYVRANAAPERLPQSSPAPQVNAPVPPSSVAAAAQSAVQPVSQAPAQPIANPALPPGVTSYAAIFAQQMQMVTDLLQRQMQLLERAPGSAAAPALQAPHAIASAAVANPVPAQSVPPPPPLPDSRASQSPEKELGTLVPIKPLVLRTEEALTPEQAQHVRDLTARYTARTSRSKAHVAQFRGVLADPRVASGFHPDFKELVYPIVAERSAGAYLWDTNGNRYIDILNGYGSIFFGHSPSFVTDAVRRQLDLGFPIGPHTELAGECAQLVADLTGSERVTFCNTGSEAVMAAVRLARTVTGRSLVVLFSGAYHGMIDEVLVKSTRGERSIPAAPGIPRESVSNVLVLEYGSPTALEVIRRRKEEIAAVLVEPIQSRHPDLRPIEFLKEIRTITEGAGAVLIFDEVVTGFRTHPGGAQALFGIRPDLSTYGKVVAGGMPVGVVAGSRAYMDALDGGQWQFGDDSIPQVGVTFFAGTFVRHPLTMAAVKAVLQHLKAAGPALQSSMAGKSDLLVRDLKSLFQEFSFPSAIQNFSSWFFFPSPAEARLGRLLYYHLRERGLHIQEGFPCFLSTVHTEADLAEVRSIFRAALSSMRDGHALPRPAVAAVAEWPAAAHVASIAAAATPAAPALPVEAPITEAQREILLASQLGPEASCAFNESVSLTLEGALNRDLLTEALHTLIARHEALRLTLTPDGESIRIAASAKIDVTGESWATLDGQAQQIRMQQLLQQEASTPFDLINGPLVRACLIELSVTRHVFVLTGHHIVLDGWSMNVLFEELGTLYSAGLLRKDASLLPAQSLAEFAREERTYRTSEDHQQTEAFWLERFRQASPTLDLPTDRPRPALRSHEGATFRHVFSPEFLTLMRRSAQQNGQTLFTLLLSGYAALLSRLAQQPDVTISVPMAGQREVEDKSFIGHSVNFLPIRIAALADTPFHALARQVKESVYDALDHQRYTLGTLVQKLALPRNPSRIDLAELQFNLEQVGSRMHFEGLAARLEANPKAAVNADLFFNFVDRGDSLVLDCDYNTTLFAPETIARWVNSLEILLREAAAVPARPIGELQLLDTAELQRLLVEWNDTAAEYPRDRSIAEVFQAQASQRPDAVALSFGNETWTYAQLNARANRMAAWLLQHYGDRTALRVAISAERAPELIVAILATLKAGGLYIPIDASYPAARLALLVEDATPNLLLTQQRLQHLFADLPLRTVCFEDLAPELAHFSDHNLPSRAAGDSPAYVMYTSGSTGKPKGVVIPHRAILRLVQNTTYASFGPDEVFLQLAPISFDASTFEIWGALLNGGRLVLMPGNKPSPEEIGAAIRRHGVTTVWLTAALYHLMIMDHLTLLTPLKQLLAGGDVLSAELTRRLLQATPHLRLINGYGPTENCTFTCCHPIRLEDLEGGNVPIGRPIANTRIYILDASGRPVPVGVPGDLYAAGDGLALGYLNAPELTAERFVTRDLGPAGIESLYKTGDTARYKSNGTVEFLGRTDSQIKIRGFRVELGEIEWAAEKFPSVRAAVASPRSDWMTAEDVPGDKRIALYVIADQGIDEAHLKQDLRQHLRTQLPEHMQPQAILLVETFPRTVNGKVDHRLLPASQAERALRKEQVDEPRNGIESQLVAIWSRVLQLPRIGIHDSIFELGGDSLSIFRITTQANQAGLRLSAKHLFQFKTIAALSSEIDGQTGATDEPAPARTIQAVSRDRFRKVQTL